MTTSHKAEARVILISEHGKLLLVQYKSSKGQYWELPSAPVKCSDPDLETTAIRALLEATSLQTNDLPEVHTLDGDDAPGQLLRLGIYGKQIPWEPKPEAQAKHVLRARWWDLSVPHETSILTQRILRLKAVRKLRTQ